MSKRSLCQHLTYGGCKVVGILVSLNTNAAQKYLPLTCFQSVDLYIQCLMSVSAVCGTALRLDSGGQVCKGKCAHNTCRF